MHKLFFGLLKVMKFVALLILFLKPLSVARSSPPELALLYDIGPESAVLFISIPTLLLVRAAKLSFLRPIVSLL